jgi:hypothetical protein
MFSNGIEDNTAAWHVHAHREGLGRKKNLDEIPGK